MEVLLVMCEFLAQIGKSITFKIKQRFYEDHTNHENLPVNICSLNNPKLINMFNI